MFKVEPNGRGGYTLSVGDGKPVQARTLAEAHKALDHYYGAIMHPFGGKRRTCPFCRQLIESR